MGARILRKLYPPIFSRELPKLCQLKIYKTIDFNVIPFNLITQKYCALDLFFFFVILGFGNLYADVSKHFVCSIFIGGVSRFVLLTPPMKIDQTVFRNVRI